MGALKTTFVLFLLLLAGGVTFLSVNRDPLGGEPFQMVKVEPANYDALLAEAEAAQAAAQRQQQEELARQQQEQQGQQPQAQPQAMSQADTPPELQQTAQPAQEPTGLELQPLTGQAPPRVLVDPNAGITATDMMPTN
jgi:hypothetical protein